MKKIACIILALMVTTPLFAMSGSENQDHNNVLKINTLTLILGSGTIYYERKIDDNLSAQLGTTYLSYTFSDTKFTGLNIVPEVRFYFQDNAVNGVYAAPYLRYQNFSLKNTETETSATYSNFGGGGSIGRQWITDSGFSFDLFFGIHYGAGKVSGSSVILLLLLQRANLLVYLLRKNP